MNDDYDPAEDARKCYDVAIAAKRARGDKHYPIPFSQQPWKRREVIGDCTLLLGDCLEILPTLGKVDCSDAVVYSQTYEKPAERQHRSPARSDENLGASQGRNLGAVCERHEVSTGDGGQIRRDTGRIPESAEADGNTIQVARQTGRGEREIQARSGSAHLSDDGGEGSLCPVRRDGEPLHPPQRRGPLQQHAGQLGSDVHELPQFNAQEGVVGLPQGWAILTDPPYGIGMDGGKVGRSEYEAKPVEPKQTDIFGEAAE